MSKLIKGVEIEMGGETFTVPPLTLGAIEDLQDEMVNMGNADPKVQNAAMVKLIHTAMLRNYPDMTIERLKNELLDIGNLLIVTEAVMGNSGLVKKMGEQMVAAMVSSTGENSTQA